MEFYRIQIEDVALTKDGTNAGRNCLLTVAGADALLQTKTGNVFQALDGTPYAQLSAFTKGKTLEIQVEILMQSVWQDVVALINNALANQSALNINGTGDLGDFDVNAIPLVPKPYEARDFIDGRIIQPKFRFITI